MFNAIKSAAVRGYQFVKRQAVKVVGVGAGTAVVTSNAMAALPTEVTAAFQAQTDNYTAIMALVWPLVTLATGGWILVKLFKKGANKAI